MIALQLLGLALFLSFFAIVFRGAPYVPTHRQSVDRLVKKVLKPTDVMVDLGSGDGRLLHRAAGLGIRCYGYELNPFLYLVSRVRLYRSRRLASVYLQDFWQSDLPDDTTVVYVFLATHFMKKLDVYMQEQSTRLGKPLVLVSHAIAIGGRQPVRSEGALLIYNYQP